MTFQPLEENCMAAIGINQFQQHWDAVKLVARYRDGRHVDSWERYVTSDVAKETYQLASAWRTIGLEPQQTVAIMAPNRPRWLTTLYSLLFADAVMVPVYPTLTPDDVAYILNDAQAQYAVVGGIEHLEKIQSRFDDLPHLRKVFVMDADAVDETERIGSYDAFLAMGHEHPDATALMDRVRQASTEDVASIIYTSGTTGRPKGAVLTNGNFMSQRAALECFDLSPDDIFLSHLPFSHSFGLTADLLGSIMTGACLVISDGITPDKIRHALTTIRPTVLMSVPRLFEKIYVQVHQVVERKPARIQALFHSALGLGKQVFDLRNEGQPIPLGLQVRYALAKRITGKVLRQAGLDRVRIAYAGGAPSSKELCYFFQSLGIELYQGYGLTETSPIANVNRPGRNKLGTVGPPIAGVEERIAEDGEVLVRGPNVMRGYHNLPEETAEAIDEDGWFHTGDIGDIDQDGYLSIRDRKKELIITSGGKNVAPLPIESAFNTDAYVQRVVVIGEARKYLSALVCPDFDLLRPWAKKQGLHWTTDAELAALPEVKAMLEERVLRVNEDLPRFSQIKKIAVMDHEFSEETGELTPTEKVKRRVVDEVYADIIEALYAE